MNSKQDPGLSYALWRHHKRRDRILGVPETELTRAVQRHGAVNILQDANRVAGLMAEAEQLRQKVRNLHRQFNAVKRNAEAAKKKSLVNQCYKKASQLFLKAEEAEARLLAIEQELVTNG